MRHVGEYKPAAADERFVERVVADNVASQAGGAAQTVGVRFFAWHGAANDAGSVRHLDHVRHVVGGRCVEDGDGHAVVDDIKHLGDQKAGVQGDRFARLEVDLYAVRVTGSGG